MSTQRLRQELVNRSVNGLGNTEEGVAWCTKALHPSDPVSECCGIPDESAVPSAHMNFMSTFQFKAPTGSTDTWGFDLDVIPHPVAMAALNTFDASVSHVYAGALLNTQLTGADHYAKYVTFKGYAQRWRMTYCGVTVYQDGAALTNQGTLQACQRPVEPRYMHGTAGTYVAGALQNGYMQRKAMTFQAGDQTTFETVANMPNAYVGRSAEGCYLPLIVTSTCQKWHGEHDEVQYQGKNTVAEDGYGLILGGTGTGKWPFYDVTYGPGQSTGPTSVYAGQSVSKPASNIWGLICARNLDITTSFTIVVRSGWELQCQPGTLLTPQLHLSPAYDPKAIGAYFAIRRELKDAYPADYNDWAKIWGVIKKVASVVLPGISLMGPIGAAVGGAGSAALSVVDAITNAVRKKSQPVEQGRNPIPEAAKERAQDLIKAAAVVNTFPPRKAPREVTIRRAQLQKKKK